MTKQEAREKAKTDAIYLAQILGYDMIEDVHRDLFKSLASTRDKRLILWPRGHFKTSCVCVELVRRILIDPNIRVIVMQATLKLTKGWIKEIRSAFDGTNPKSRLAELFPEFCWTGKKSDALSFTVPARTRRHLKEATCTAASPRATATGQHYTLAAFDDLVNTSNFRSPDLLDKVQSEFYHYLPLMDPGSDVIVTGTRYSFADLYGHIIAKDTGINEWEISVRSVYGQDGKLLFPQQPTRDGTRNIGFTVELLASLQRQDPEMYGPQYENRILAAKDQLFPQELLQKATKSQADPAYPRGAYCVFAVDLAQTTNANSDNSVITVGRNDSNGRLWLEDIVGGQFSPFVLAQTIVGMYLRHRPAKIYIERAAGAEFFAEYLRVIAREKGVNLPIDFLKVSRTKDAKYLQIASLEGPLKSGRLLLLAGATDYLKLLEEMEQFPRGRHDDRPDCLGMLYRALSATVSYIPPTLKTLPYFFEVPHASDPHRESSSMLGDGFVC